MFATLRTSQTPFPLPNIPLQPGIVGLNFVKMVDSQYYLPNDIGVSALDCGEAFRLLSPQEKMYAHYMSRAAWWVSVESAILFKWLMWRDVRQDMNTTDQRVKTLFQVWWFGSAAADFSRVGRHFCLATEDLQERDACTAGASRHSSWTECWGVQGIQAPCAS